MPTSPLPPKRHFVRARNIARAALLASLGSLWVGACATEANTLEPESPGKTTGGKAGSSNVGGSKASPFGGTSSGTSSGGKAGSQAAGGATGSLAGSPGDAGDAGAGGSGALVDKCQTTADCTQVPGSCFVCEASGAVKDCVDQGAPTCDNQQLEACELCETGDEKPCPEVGTPGEFSGGLASCNSTCDAWDTSACFVCGNDTQEGDEQCDGVDTAADHTCGDEQLENPTVVLSCSDECLFDTVPCNGCSKGASSCLDGDDCTSAECNGAECKLGTECAIDCSGGGVTCEDVRCNQDASCTFDCSGSARCTQLVCDSDSTCDIDCSGGGSSCNGTVCKAGASCGFDCSSAGSCEDIDCRPGAECNVNCNGGGSVCSGQASCGAGRVCDFTCNTAGDCGALEVTCETGSSCSFSCVGGGSVCPKATCADDSSCTFACAGGSCNNPTCALGACTGHE